MSELPTDAVAGLLTGVARADPLGILSEAQARGGEALALAARHLDPSLVDVLRTIGFDRDYVTASGSYIYDTAGRAHLDMHGGEGFSSLGHANPDVKATLHAILDADLLDGVQIHYSVLAGMLAQELSAKLPAGLDATYFTNAGAEAVDSAMKFARAATGRPRLIACERGYHGVTLGPLSIVRVVTPSQYGRMRLVLVRRICRGLNNARLLRAEQGQCRIRRWRTGHA